jgi:hypothetical protein
MELQRQLFSCYTKALPDQAPASTDKNWVSRAFADPVSASDAIIFCGVLLTLLVGRRSCIHMPPAHVQVRKYSKLGGKERV